MQHPSSKFRTLDKSGKIMTVVVLLSVILAACSSPTPTPAPTTDPSVIQTQSAQTVVAQLTADAPPPATSTPAVPPGPTPDPNVPVAVLTQPQEGQPTATADYNTAILSGPGTHYVVYGAFLGGEKALAVGRSEDGLWWVVELPVAPNQIGWVSDAYVTVVGGDGLPVYPTPPIPETTVPVPPEAGDPQATALVNTYVRTGPADTYPAYGIAKAGALALVIGKSEDGLWLTIRLDPKVVGKGYGWIALQYVEASDIENVPVVEEGAPPVVEAPPAPVEGAPSATAADYLNVRTGPGTNYPVVVVAPPGATGEVTGRSADNIWWQVKVSTQYVASGLGWVSQDYTYSSNTDAVPVVDAPPPPEYPANPAPGTCSLVSQTPADGSTAVAGSTFTTTWELQNTSDETWIAANNDIRYYASIDNINLYTGSALYDVQEDVAPNGTIVVSIPMIAPDAPGSYGDLWGISAGEDNPPVCQFWVTINVQ